MYQAHTKTSFCLSAVLAFAFAMLFYQSMALHTVTNATYWQQKT